MARPIKVLELTEEERAILNSRVSSSKTSKRDHQRARVVLLRAAGLAETEVARRLSLSLPSVSKWSKRFSESGLVGLKDKAGRGRKARLPKESVEKVLTNVTRPPEGKKRWTVRLMAKETGISRSRVHELWQINDLKPHRTRTFKISNDPHFEAKFWDVIGLYLNPPEHALVLCCDEKSQCQALERTQPGLPLGVGHIQTRTHDYKRHGTITLFAALDYITGKLHSRTEKRHTHVEWLRFLKQLDRETPSSLDVHLIVDNYCTHKHEKVRNWLEKHSRFKVHFTPTSSSWMNLVERFFADLTSDVVAAGSFCSTKELIRDIEDYLIERNADPKPYRWRARGEDILRKIQRAKEVMSQQAA